MRKKNVLTIDCAQDPNDEGEKSPHFSRINRLLELLRAALSSPQNNVFLITSSFRKKNRANAFTSEQFYEVLLSAIPKISTNLAALHIRNELDATNIRLHASISYLEEPGSIERSYHPRVNGIVEYDVVLPLSSGLSKEDFQKQVDALITLKKKDVLKIIEERQFLGKALTYEEKTY